MSSRIGRWPGVRGGGVSATTLCTPRNSAATPGNRRGGSRILRGRGAGRACCPAPQGPTRGAALSARDRSTVRRSAGGSTMPSAERPAAPGPRAGGGDRAVGRVRVTVAGAGTRTATRPGAAPSAGVPPPGGSRLSRQASAPGPWPGLPRVQVSDGSTKRRRRRRVGQHR